MPSYSMPAICPPIARNLAGKTPVARRVQSRFAMRNRVLGSLALVVVLVGCGVSVGLGVSILPDVAILPEHKVINETGLPPITNTELALVVADHAGKIWVDSHPGRGATFHIELPA